MKLSDLRPLNEHYDPGEDRYHKDIGFPDDLEFPRGFLTGGHTVISLRYGTHSREEAMKEKYGVLQLPQRIDLKKADIFEVGTKPGSNVIEKVCVRMQHDSEKDIVIVVMIPSGFVKTVWANLRNDDHKTLNRANYKDPNANAHRQRRAA